MHPARRPLRHRRHKGAHCPRCKIRAETISQCLSACPPHSMHVPICLCVRATIAAQMRQRDSSLFTRHCSWCLASGPCHDPWHCHWLISGAHCAPGQHPLAPITPPTPTVSFPVAFLFLVLYFTPVLYMKLLPLLSSLAAVYLRS